MTTDIETIHQDLLDLKKDMAFVREHIEDITLTEDDLKSFEEAEEDLKEGRTKRLI